MGKPSDIKVIDLMLGIPASEDMSAWYDFLEPLLMDQESKQMFKMPAQYMFRNIPELEKRDDYVAFTIEQMDKHNIEMAMTSFSESSPLALQAQKDHSDRFFFDHTANPNNGMDEVRLIRRLHKEYGIKALNAFPCGLCPQVPINDKKWYPIYATCVDLDIAFCCCVGVPGPRVPMAPQKVELIDEVCYFFRN